MNKRKTLSCGIDIAAPGGVAALLEFHRKTFGDAVMRTVTPGEPAPTPTPTDPPAPNDPPAPPPAPQDGTDPDDIEGLGDAGKRALKAERKRAEDAEKERNELKRRLDEKDRAEMNDLQRAQKDAEDLKTDNAKLRTENLRLKAIAHHEIPEEYQELVHGTDEASFKASAEKVAQLAAAAAGKTPPPPKADPVPLAGGGHTGTPPAKTGGTDAGREEYNRRHNKNKS